jgi:hypothetical protein
MHKPPISRMSLLATMATAFGLNKDTATTAQIFKSKRGAAPKGKKWISGVYMPAGPRCNVEPTKIKNPKIGKQMNEMYEKWRSAKLAREAKAASNG